VHLLPLSLSRLADHASRGDVARFALGGVLLRVRPDNTFEAVATDSRVLARVSGPCVADPAAFPAIPGFSDAPDGQPMALIPAGTWKRVFGYAGKLTRRPKTDNSAIRSVAVRIGETETTFGITDGGDNSYTDAAPNIFGRYPPYEDVVPRRGGGRDQLAIDPRLLGDLLRTAAEFSPDGRDLPRVEIETQGLERPLVIRTGRTGGSTFEGIIMPLLPDPAATAAAGLPAADDPDRVAALERLCAALLSERADLARRVAGLEAALAAARVAPPVSPPQL
jgi:hypothetical protein